MATDKRIRTAVIEKLRAMGWRAVPIKERQTKTPDLIAPGSKGNCLIEIKSREPFIRHVPNEGESEATHFFNRPDPWVLTRTRNAMDQFRSFDPNQEKFWLLWFETNTHGGSRGTTRSVINTVFGRKFLYVTNEDEFGVLDPQRDAVACYKSQEPLFSKFPELIGIVACQRRTHKAERVILNEVGTWFCVNENHMRFDEFCTTALYKGQKRQNAVKTLSMISDDASTIFSDRYFDDDNDLSQHIAEKYGYKKVMVVPELKISISAKV